VDSIEVVGDPNLTLTSAAPTVLGISSGSYIISQCLADRTIAVTASTHGNTTLDTISPGTAGFQVGASISGTGIPLGTTIASITSSTALVLSAPATASATGVAVTTTGKIPVAPATNSVVGLSFFLSNSLIQVQGE